MYPRISTLVIPCESFSLCEKSLGGVKTLFSPNVLKLLVWQEVTGGVKTLSPPVCLKPFGMGPTEGSLSIVSAQCLL